MASWKKILTDGDNTNLANSDLTQDSSGRTYFLGSSGGSGLRFRPSSAVTEAAFVIGSTDVTSATGTYVQARNFQILPRASSVGTLSLYDLDASAAVSLQSPDTVATEYAIVLPDTEGAVDDMLKVTSNASNVTTLTFGQPNSIDLDTSNLTSVGDYQGEFIEYGSMAAGVTYTAGGLYILTSSGWALPDMTSPLNVNLVNGLMGVAIGSSPTNGGFLLRGLFVPQNYSNLTAGAPVYVNSSFTPRGVTGTAPTGVGDYVRIVGHCVQATSPRIISFNPSQDYILIE